MKFKPCIFPTLQRNFSDKFSLCRYAFQRWLSTWWWTLLHIQETLSRLVGIVDFEQLVSYRSNFNKTDDSILFHVLWKGQKRQCIQIVFLFSAEVQFLGPGRPTDCRSFRSVKRYWQPIVIKFYNGLSGRLYLQNNTTNKISNQYIYTQETWNWVCLKIQNISRTCEISSSFFVVFKQTTDVKKIRIVCERWKQWQ